MGRAGGGSRGGGGRSGGGGFSRSGGSSSSHSRSSSGSRSSFSGSSFSGSSSSSHRSSRTVIRPVIIPPVYGRSRKTVIINNNGAPSGQGNTGGHSQGQTYTNRSSGEYREPAAPKPLTTEQKINRAERLKEEAKTGKGSALKLLLVAAVIIGLGLFVAFTNRNGSYEKASFAGTKDAGYVKDEGFLKGHYKTEAALKELYEKTGIPLFVYTIADYQGEEKSCDDYAMQLYDKLFTDENHALLVYYDNMDWWSWATGIEVRPVMTDAAFDTLIDEFYEYWYNDSYSNDEVFAKGIQSYMNQLTSRGNGSRKFAGILYFIGGVLAFAAVVSYASKSKEEKRYAEEAQQLRREQILGQPLETFGNQEVENLKDKYD